MSDAGKSEAGQEGGDVAGVGDSEGSGRAVMIEGEAEEFCGEGVGFAMIQGREARDEKGKVRGVLVFDAEVVNYQDKGDGARGVMEKTGSEGLVKVEGVEEGDKAKVRQLTGFFEAVHRLLYAEDDVRLSGFVLFNKG